MSFFKEKKHKVIITILCIVCFGTGVSIPLIYQKSTSAGFDSKLDAVKSILKNDWYYANQIENLDTLLEEQALKGMTTLEIDPHTNYFSLEQAKKFSSSLQGTNTGIGIQLYKQNDGNIFVKYVFINSAADHAGLQHGDILTHVGDLECAHASLEEVISYIKDRDGKELEFKYLRDGKSKSVKMTPSTYDSTVICNVYDDYGEIILSSFSQHSGKDVAAALARLKKAGINHVILDLRDNTGGYLSAAVEIASTFLPSETIVFYEEDKDGNLTEVLTDDSFGQIEMDKIVVLQNEKTASASEALIGALKDTLKDKVTLVGTTTYGKGTEQTSVPFEDGTSLKYTMARWLTPKKESINKVGFKPDVMVEDTSIGSITYKPLKEEEVIKADTVDINAPALQSFLKFLGYPVDRVDEYFSKSSAQGLKTFQQDYDLAPTGNCDFKTWEKLSALALEKYNQEAIKMDNVRNEALHLLKNKDN